MGGPSEGVDDSNEGVDDSNEGVDDSNEGVDDSNEGVDDSNEGVDDSNGGVGGPNEDRWDCHPKPDAPTVHGHPPSEASTAVDPSDLEDAHRLAVLFDVLDWSETRIAKLHGT